MDPNYLDDSKTTSTVLQQFIGWDENQSKIFHDNMFPTFTNLQNAFLRVLSKNKKRILIECQYPQGKTICSILKVLTLILKEQQTTQKG